MADTPDLTAAPELPELPEPFFRTSKTGGAFSIDQLRARDAMWQDRVRQAVAQERERGADLCDSMALYTGVDCAAAIRKG